MQGYPGYQTPMSMQYQPMYGQQQMQQPYLDRLAQLQAMQQNLQQPQQPQQFFGLNGRVVDSFDSIMASDVPMDGTFAMFPKRDMSEVCVKYWTGEGKIATIVFKPMSEVCTEVPADNESRAKLDELSNVLGGIYEKIDVLSNKVDEALKTKNFTRGNNKKEASADE